MSLFSRSNRKVINEVIKTMNRPEAGLFFLRKISPIISNSYLSQCSHNSNLNVISEEIQTLKSDDWKFLGSHNIGVAGASFTLPSDWKEVAITLKPNDIVGGVALGTHLKSAIINSAITQARFGTYNYGIVYNISNDGNTFTYANYFSGSMASTKIDVYYK